MKLSSTTPSSDVLLFEALHRRFESVPAGIYLGRIEYESGDDEGEDMEVDDGYG